MRLYQLFTRLSFSIVYFWFGILKILGLGQAFPLVSDLCISIIPNIDPHVFFLILGILEIYIAILFLFPKLLKLAVIITSIHLFTTFLPMIFLKNHIWIQLGVLTMEGQYILKNLFIISALIGLWLLNPKDTSSQKQ